MEVGPGRNKANQATRLLTLDEAWREPRESSPAETLVALGSEQVDFLVDIWATSSLLYTHKGTFSQDTVTVIGAPRKRENMAFFQPLNFKTGRQWLMHHFLYVPECLMPVRKRYFKWNKFTNNI